MADQKTVLTILAKDKTAAAFKSIQSAATKTRKRVNELTPAFIKFGTGAATAAATALAAFTRMSMVSIDNLGKTADKLGTPPRRWRASSTPPSSPASALRP